MALKYKVGDKVRIKSIDWYNKNINCEKDIVFENGFHFTPAMTRFCGKIFTIKDVWLDGYYEFKEIEYCWTDDMIEGLAEEGWLAEEGLVEEYSTTNNEVVNYMRMDKITSVIFHDQNYQDKVELNLGDYELKQEGDKWFAIKKKPKYPTTYEECCDVLKIPNDERYIDIDVPLDYNKLLTAFTKLLICRDAYWKIAGIEMGLGKPWEPSYIEESFEQGSPIKYIIYYTGTYIAKERKASYYLLSFPTAEMRDAFYENFKDLIEECKELL